MREELTYIETLVQTELDAYLANNSSNLAKASMVDTSSMVSKYSDYLDEQQITMVYRELPGMQPGMPVADKIINANIFVYALESEKLSVKAIIDNFIDNNKKTLHTMTNGGYKIKLQFTNLTPIGNAGNQGSKIYQAWQFGVTITVIDTITSIFDREITLVDPDTSTTRKYNAGNGLVDVRFEKIPVYAEYPTDGGVSKKIYRYTNYILTFSIIDSLDVAVDFLSSLVLSQTKNTLSSAYKKGSKVISFTGKITSAIDDVSEDGYPMLTFTIERG